MGYPYSNGDVLSHSDMNAVGLHLITPSSVTNGTLSGATISIGSGQNTLTVNGVFSADFDNYKIVSTDITGSANAALQMRLGTSTAGAYRYVGFYQTWASSTLVGYGPTVSSSWDSVGRVTSGTNFSVIEMFNPFVSKDTFGKSTSSAEGSSEYSIQLNLTYSQTTSFTGFQFIAASGNFTGGTVRVYGYSNG